MINEVVQMICDAAVHHGKNATKKGTPTEAFLF